MTDAELLEEVKRHWEHWAEHLGLSPNWWLDFKIDDALSNRMEMRFTGAGYQRVVLAVAPNVSDDSEKDWPMALNVLHETCHILTQPCSWAAQMLLTRDALKHFDEIEEGVTDTLASIIWRLHEASGCTR